MHICMYIKSFKIFIHIYIYIAFKIFIHIYTYVHKCKSTNRQKFTSCHSFIRQNSYIPESTCMTYIYPQHTPPTYPNTPLHATYFHLISFYAHFSETNNQFFLWKHYNLPAFHIKKCACHSLNTQPNSETWKISNDCFVWTGRAFGTVRPMGFQILLNMNVWLFFLNVSQVENTFLNENEN